jgi:hypothetical protein
MSHAQVLGVVAYYAIRLGGALVALLGLGSGVASLRDRIAARRIIREARLKIDPKVPIAVYRRVGGEGKDKMPPYTAVSVGANEEERKHIVKSTANFQRTRLIGGRVVCVHLPAEKNLDVHEWTKTKRPEEKVAKEATSAAPAEKKSVSFEKPVRSAPPPTPEPEVTQVDKRTRERVDLHDSIRDEADRLRALYGDSASSVGLASGGAADPPRDREWHDERRAEWQEENQAGFFEAPDGRVASVTEDSVQGFGRPLPTRPQRPKPVAGSGSACGCGYEPCTCRRGAIKPHSASSKTSRNV